MRLSARITRTAAALAFALGTVAAAPTAALATGNVLDNAADTRLIVTLDASAAINTKGDQYSFKFEGLADTDKHTTTADEANAAAATFAPTSVTWPDALTRSLYLKFLPTDPSGKFPHAGVYRFRVTENAGTEAGVTYSTARYLLTVRVKNDADHPTRTIDKGNGETEMIDGLVYGEITAEREETNGTTTKVNPSDPSTNDQETSTSPNSNIFRPVKNTDPETEPDGNLANDPPASGYLVFNNVYNRVSSIKITMGTSGDYADKTKTFAVTPTINVPKGTQLSIKIGDDAPANYTADESGKITLPVRNLKSGDEVTISGLPVGATYKLEQAATANYKPKADCTYVYKNDEGTETKAGAWSETAANFGDPLTVEKAPSASVKIEASTTVGEGANEIKLTSIADDTALSPTPTGLLQRNLPYILAIGGALAGIAAILVIGARHGEEDR